MKSLVIGAGEVGTSLNELINGDIIDESDILAGQYDVIHICFPYSESFIPDVRGYRERYNTIYTVIHSTVPVGTCETLGAFHCPVRGVHPNLSESMLKFTTYLAPISDNLAEYFDSKGFNITQVANPRNTEAGKLMSTMQYGIQIMVEKEIHRYCEKHDLDFGVVYKEFNRTYNEGYKAINKPQFKRPILKQVDGEIGGHCVMQNLELFDNWLADVLEKRNETYKK